MIRKIWNRLFDIREGESQLTRRLRKYGTRGIIHVPSPEGRPYTVEDVRHLGPAGDK